MKRRKPSCQHLRPRGAEKERAKLGPSEVDDPNYNDLTSKTVDKIVPRIVDNVFKNFSSI